MKSILELIKEATEAKEIKKLTKYAEANDITLGDDEGLVVIGDYTCAFGDDQYLVA